MCISFRNCANARILCIEGKVCFLVDSFAQVIVLGFLRSTDQEYTVYLSDFVIFVHEFLGIITGIIDMIITSTSFLPDVVVADKLFDVWMEGRQSHFPIRSHHLTFRGHNFTPFSREFPGSLVGAIGDIYIYNPQYLTYIPLIYYLYYCLLGDYISPLPPF